MEDPKFIKRLGWALFAFSCLCIPVKRSSVANFEWTFLWNLRDLPIYELGVGFVFSEWVAIALVTNYWMGLIRARDSLRKRLVEAEVTLRGPVPEVFYPSRKDDLPPEAYHALPNPPDDKTCGQADPRQAHLSAGERF